MADSQETGHRTMPKVRIDAGGTFSKECIRLSVLPTPLCQESTTQRKHRPGGTTSTSATSRTVCHFLLAQTVNWFLASQTRRLLIRLLVPFLLFLVVASAMASHEHSEGMPQSVRLKELLRRALASHEPSEALAEAAKKGGVRVIAADFDLTMLTLHTGGSASNRPDNPIFKALSKDFDAFAAAANARGIQVAVVTFGALPNGSMEAHMLDVRLCEDPKALAGRPGRIAGEPLVRRVLQTSGASFRVDGVFSFYPPLYSSPADYRALGLTCPMPHNKSFHIQKLRKQFGIGQQEVLLIDDDVNNCAAFAADGGVSLRVTGDRGFDLTHLEVL